MGLFFCSTLGLNKMLPFSVSILFYFILTTLVRCREEGWKQRVRAGRQGLEPGREASREGSTDAWPAGAAMPCRVQPLLSKLYLLDLPTLGRFVPWRLGLCPAARTCTFLPAPTYSLWTFPQNPRQQLIDGCLGCAGRCPCLSPGPRPAILNNL